MNKKIKRIITINITAFTISSLGNALPLNKSIMLTKVYAAETTSIYLKDLSLNKSDIDFDQDTFFYDVKVDKDVNEIKITATPKSNNSEVLIDGDSVDEDDKYKRTVTLEDGNNIIKIKVSNDEEYKIYTLNILRGETKQDNIYLDNISLGNGNTNFSKNITDYEINVKESVDKITIGAIPEQNTHEVTIDGAKANKEDNYKQTVELNKGKNPIIIKVKNKNNDQRTYILNINRQNGLESKETQDDIYLDYIKIDDNKAIYIDKSKSVYDLSVNENTEQIDLRVEPESTEYKVKINDKIVEEVDNYTKTLILKPGINQFTIKLQDEINNKQRSYTLNINRGQVVNNQSTDVINIGKSTNNSSSNNLAIKYNQWVQISAKWQYNDSTGNPLRSTWFYDRNTNKNYYLQADGTMAIGWLLNNGHWYYLDKSGARQTGWLLNDGEWYYLNSEGIMQTGWIKDSTGKYYYLQSNGIMAKNIKIDGFKLGSNGAWIK